MPANRKEYMREYMKKYRQRTVVKEKQKKYEQKYSRRPEVKKRRQEYNQRPEIKEYMREYYKAYYQRPEIKLKNQQPERKMKWKEYMREYYKEYQSRPEVRRRHIKRQKNSPHLKKRQYLRATVRKAVIHQRRFTSTIHKLIGCDVATARAHLEAQFEDWMNWDNYGRGKGKWCIDHIVAVASIDIFDEEEVKRIFHYTNMQPLEFCKNSEKGCNES